jgi:hypothetical protein
MRLQLPTAYRHLYDIAENARKDQAIRVGLGPVLLDGEDALLVPSSVARWEAKLPPRDPDITEMPAALAEIARRVLDCQVVFMQVEPKAEQE